MTTKNTAETGESTASRVNKDMLRDLMLVLALHKMTTEGSEHLVPKLDDNLSVVGHYSVELDPKAFEQIQKTVTAASSERLDELMQEERRLRRSIVTLGRNATVKLIKQLREIVDERAQIIRTLDIRKVVLS